MGKNLNTIPYTWESQFLQKSTIGDYRFFINWLQKIDLIQNQENKTMTPFELCPVCGG